MSASLSTAAFGAVLRSVSGAALSAVSAPVHRRSLGNAREALFERRRRDLDALHTWRDLEARLGAGARIGPAGETA